jgi:hypothetical protein
MTGRLLVRLLLILGSIFLSFVLVWYFVVAPIMFL